MGAAHAQLTRPYPCMTFHFFTVYALRTEREAGHEATRFHTFSRRRHGGMAARCARAAEGDAGDRRPQRPSVQRVFWTVYGRVPPRTERSRLRRGTEFAERITIGC